MQKANMGLIGLAVMGANLARNMANNGYRVNVYNRTKQVTEQFLTDYPTPNLSGSESLEQFVQSLETPRKIFIMVKAGKPVDELIEQLIPLLDKWDILIDCGNSFYRDTERRNATLSEKGMHFIGCWVSGGEEWALKWPSIMPGGDHNAYLQIEDILESIAARDFSSGECVTYIWEGGSWHFVKMVHNGIEYAIMQMIAEAYDGLRKIYGLDAGEIAKIFALFNSWRLNSYLFEITSSVLSKKDEYNDSSYLIDHILDMAWAKGTGKWTSIEWLDRAESVSTIAEATFARSISANKPLRKKLSKIYDLDSSGTDLPLDEYTRVLENTLYIGILFAYAQWYALIMRTSKEEHWDINLAEVSRIWQGWCIIRARILDFLMRTFLTHQDFEHIFELGEMKVEILGWLDDYKTFVHMNMTNHVPVAAFSAGLNYFYSITQDQSSANLIQWLRDYFWAHTYERTDRSGVFHTQW